MNKLLVAVTTIAVVAVIALVDLPATVGPKALIIGVMPIEPDRKAELVLNLCKRALPAPTFAATTCLEANATDEWRQAYADRQERQSNTNRICLMFANIIAGDGPKDAKVITNDGKTASIMSEEGQIFTVDFKLKTVAWIDSGLKFIDCPNT